MTEVIKELSFTYIIPFFSDWGYMIVMAAAVVESIPFLGIVVPGGTIVILGGVFSYDSNLSIPFLIGAATIGALMGDFIGFSIGKKYGERILQKYGPHIGFKNEYLYVTHRYCIQYGGWALILGRFHQIVRPFIPLVVGATPFPYKKFWVFAVLGAAVWSVFQIMIGKIARESWELVQGYVGIIGGATVTIIFVSAFLFIRYEANKIKENKRKEKLEEESRILVEKIHEMSVKAKAIIGKEIE